MNILLLLNMMLFQQLYGLPRGISCIPLKLMLFFTSPLLRLHIAKIAEFYPTLGRRYGNNFFGDTFFSPSSWRQNYGNSITVKNVCYKTIYRSIFHIACRHVWWCSNNWLPVNVIWLLWNYFLLKNDCITEKFMFSSTRACKSRT